jgi:DNA-directed RNA polymerase specialized sigma subunit
MPEQTIAEALPYVQMAAARLIHRVASTDYDQDDLRQDLTVILLKRISKFDPARASLARFRMGPR